jgi:Flp pilus assembly protein TadG
MSLAETTAKTPSRVRQGGARRFLGNRRGNVAIEFSMLALPFAMLVFAILESCISFAGQQILSNSADRVARQLRTGQVKAAAMSEAKLKEMICADLKIIVAEGCPGLVVDLRQMATFAQAAALRIKLTADKDIDTTGFAVTPGPSMSKNTLRPVMTDFLRKSVSNLKDGKTLLFATVTWQNEPFDD